MKSDDVTVYEELGHGAFGKVYRGIMEAPLVKKKTTLTVAVKMLQGMYLRVYNFL